MASTSGASEVQVGQFGQVGQDQTEKKVEDRDEMAIAEHVSKKMRLEVELKTAEMKNLKAQKQAAVVQVMQISAELEAVHNLVEKEKESLKQRKMEEDSYQEKIETYNTE